MLNTRTWHRYSACDWRLRDPHNRVSVWETGVDRRLQLGTQNWKKRSWMFQFSGRGQWEGKFIEFDNTIISIKLFQVLLVTGGWDSSYHFLVSTEVYRPSAGEWREVPGGALPRPMGYVRVVTLNNRVLLFGKKIILICCLLPLLD